MFLIEISGIFVIIILLYILLLLKYILLYYYTNYYDRIALREEVQVNTKYFRKIN